MTRVRKPEAAIGDAKNFAILMGYRWQEDRHGDLPYNFLVFRCESVRVIREARDVR